MRLSAGQRQDTQRRNDENLAQTTCCRTMKESRDVGKTWGEIKAPARDSDNVLPSRRQASYYNYSEPRRPTGVHNQSGVNFSLCQRRRITTTMR